MSPFYDFPTERQHLIERPAEIVFAILAPILVIEEPANAPASGAYLLTLFSANPDRRWDITDTIVKLGYRPEDSWDGVQ